MAVRHSTRSGKRAVPSPCQERRLKVYSSHYTSRANAPYAVSRAIPWVQLKGDWLAQAGFAIHAALKVRVMRGCLVVTVEERPGVDGLPADAALAEARPSAQDRRR